jgi:hypothetical protein
MLTHAFHSCIIVTETLENDPVDVAEPPELFRLKCASHRCPADTNLTHFKRAKASLPRAIQPRYNRIEVGLPHSTAHQLLIYRNTNTIITSLFQT